MNERFINRVLDYAVTTGIKINKVGRLQSWARLGLPDMRGFTPHLRTVNVSLDQSPQIKKRAIPKSIQDSDLWLVHDLLHIIFYDFATINLGRQEWQRADRFIEVHLASEAFAVLALDYHHLIFTSKKGLAINLDFNDWARFQEMNSDLPELNSFHFAKALLDYYLGGAGPLASFDEGALGDLGRGKYAKRLIDWVGHEQRYAAKQRFYVMSWLDDLQAKKITARAAHITNSVVAEPLWGLLQLIHYSPDKDWAEYVKSVKKSKRVKKQKENYFSSFDKYKRQKFSLDFRFTDYRSISKAEVTQILDESVEPSASSLFLFWQLISESSPTLLNLKEKTAVRTLAIESQGRKISDAPWRAVRMLATSLLKKRRWQPDIRLRSTFFLP